MMNPPCDRICFGQPEGGEICVRYTLDHHPTHAAPIVRRPIPARRLTVGARAISGLIIWDSLHGQWHFVVDSQ